ncbi:hypothetical protein LWI29_028172 [Acer saccharum]|uniref:Uncharacterized protein n=1 Tax=Acer saccharum TaxID=4024 RepID=A0AA39VM89_ACESA|nr:hypothetical protein LWI29_028172 [Acer saccharum]
MIPLCSSRKYDSNATDCISNGALTNSIASVKVGSTLKNFPEFFYNFQGRRQHCNATSSPHHRTSAPRQRCATSASSHKTGNILLPSKNIPLPSKNIPPRWLLRQEVPKIVNSINRQLREKSIKTKVVAFSVLRELVVVLPDSLADHIGSLIPGIEKALNALDLHAKISASSTSKIALFVHLLQIDGSNATGDLEEETNLHAIGSDIMDEEINSRTERHIVELSNQQRSSPVIAERERERERERELQS